MPRAAVQASPLRFALALAVAALAFAVFAALGTWQLHRRAWKLDLIERVDRRVGAPAIAPPARARWTQVGAADDEYARVCLEGRYLHDRETLVQAVTERGAGDWLLTPLQTAAGDLVLINRGFVGPGQRLPDARRAAQLPGVAQVCGLLRLTEPGGGFLRRNDPVHARWYSRDVAAIAAAQGLPPRDVAPYFIDADAGANPGGVPAGGLTAIHFRNNHLVYAITWYALALMALAGGVLIIRQRRRV